MKYHKSLLTGAILATLVLVFSLVLISPIAMATANTTNSDSTPSAQTETQEETTPLPTPTFSTELNQETDTANLWFGSNLFAFGNLLQLNDSITSGLLIATGSELQLGATSDYSFVLGVGVTYTGITEHDLFILSSSTALDSTAQIGGDVYIAGNVATIATDLNGDLSVAAAELTLRDVSIAGNVNLSVDRLNFEGSVTIDGTLNYNDDVVISGEYEAAATSTYIIAKPSPAAIVAATIYSKLLSIAGLFLVTIIILAVFPALYTKITARSTTQKFALHLTTGLAALVVIPLLSLFALCTVIAAPLALITIVIYVIFIYLAQGITGAWLGHLITAKLFKHPTNRFVESLIGITLLGLISLIPFLGWITGFLSLLFGLGLVITHCSAGPLQRIKAVKAHPSK